jgi:hypothetical protein
MITYRDFVKLLSQFAAQSITTTRVEVNPTNAA